MPSLRAIKEETDRLSSGFFTPSFLIHEYVANVVGTVVEKKPAGSSSDGVVAGSSLAGTSTRVAVDVVEEDCLLAARKMLPAKSLFQKTIAAFLDQVYLDIPPARLIHEFLICLCTDNESINALFDEDKKLNVSVLKAFKSVTGDDLHKKEINTLMSLPAVQAFINYFDESDEAKKNFNKIKENLLREVGHFLHQQTARHNRVLVLNMAHPSVRGGRPDSRDQEEHLYRSVAGLTTLEKHEEFKAARLYKDKFTSVVTLLVQGATVFRQGAEYTILYPSEQYQVDVLYSAAPSKGKAEERERDLKKAIYAQLLTAKKWGYKNLVLNAFGCCGEFKNNPTTVAELYREAFGSSTFRYAFDCVHFAIISNSINLEVFKEKLPHSSSSLFPQPGSPSRSAFKPIPPRSNTSSDSVSGSSSTGTVESVLTSCKAERGVKVRSSSAEFFKSGVVDVGRCVSRPSS